MSSGVQLTTTLSRTNAGTSAVTPHVVAAAYALPALRDDAPNATTSNHGCPSRYWMKRWPTAPVAPSTPTRYRWAGAAAPAAAARRGGGDATVENDGADSATHATPMAAGATAR